MPTVGQKDAEGYVWNGTAWVDNKTGFVKGDEANTDPRAVWLKYKHPEDYKRWVEAGADLKTIPRPSDYSSVVGGFRSVAGTLANPAQYVKDVPVLGTVASFAQQLSPTTYVGKGMQLGEQGKYLGAGLNFATAALPALSKLYPGMALLPGVGKVMSHPVLAGVAGSTVAGLLGADKSVTYNRDRLSSILPGRIYTTHKTTADTAERQASAADFRRVEESYKTADKMEREAGTTAGAPTAPTKPVAPGLLPLTPEQIWDAGQQMTAAEKAYNDLLNEQKLQKEQAQREYTQQVQGLQRQAAGQTADIAGQMAGSGMDISPATAFGVEQTTQAPLVAGSQAARKSLNQYMADLVAAQKKAKAARDTTIMDINRQKKIWQVGNTLASQQAAYGNMVPR